MNITCTWKNESLFSCLDVCLVHAILKGHFCGNILCISPTRGGSTLTSLWAFFFVKLQRNNSTSRFSPPPAVHFTKPSCAGPFPFRNLSQCLGWVEGFLGAHLHLPEGCSCKRRTQVPNLLQTRPRFLMKCKARWLKCGFSSYRSHFLKLKTSQAE